MRFWIMIILVLGLGLLGSPLGSHAATIPIASCTTTAFNTAHASAASAGDILEFPACNVNTWTTVTVTKAVTIKGQGVANTIIGRADAAAGYESNAMFRVQGTTGIRIFQDFTINGTQDTNEGKYQPDMGIWLNFVGQFRIHHMNFTYIGIAIQVHGDPTVQNGVIDHSTFTNIYTQACNCNPNPGADSYGYAVSVVGNDIYGPLVLGTSAAVFIEDNTFDHAKIVAANNNGGRYVARNNTIISTSPSGAAFDMHGHAAWPVGARSCEIYNNTINMGGSGDWMAMGITGGDCVIYDNTIDSRYSNKISLNTETSGTPCSGTYPQPYQIRDTYVWGNTIIQTGAAITPANNCSSLLQLNRDYFTTPRPGYTAYTYPHPLTAASAPPVVTITAPNSGNNTTVTSSPLTTLAGTASDDISVSSVAWSCDVCGSGAATGTTSWSVASITLVPGPNVITVTATDGDGLPSTDTITVTLLVTQLRIDAGGPGGTFSDGLYQADAFVSGGTAFDRPGRAIANTTDDVLYASERFGTMTYTLPLQNGTYTVTLKFAEMSATAIGQRLFHVDIQGTRVLTNFDIFALAGADTALDQSFPATVSAGTLTIVLTTVANNAEVVGITVVPLVSTAAPVVLRLVK